jgi:flavodoxin
MEMRKIFKIVLAVLAVLIIIFVAFSALIFLDLAAFTATGTQTLAPSGTSVGNALVVYDPGLSGAAKSVASKIATNLQTHGYTVNLAGIKSSTATHTAGFEVIVAGGPIYAGTPTSSVKDFLNNLKPDQGAKIGVFGSGQGATTPEDVAQIINSSAALQNGGSLTNAVVVKIGSGEDLDTRSADFITQLLK